MIPMFVVVIAPAVFTDMYWGEDVWGDLAPSWPGGAYVFAAVVGALAPLALVLFVSPLSRMNWAESKPRSLGWAAASLPGLAAGEVIAGVVFATLRPKRHRDWDAGCHSRGGPCWVHEEFPYLRAVGTLATVAASALLIGLFVLSVRRRDRSATRPATSAPPGPPPPSSPTRT